MRNFLLGGPKRIFELLRIRNFCEIVPKTHGECHEKAPRAVHGYGIGTELRSGWSVFLLCVVKRAS